MIKRLLTVFVAFTLSAAGWAQEGSAGHRHLEKATFAGGCFWCIQPVFDDVPGVVKTTVGFTGGKEPHPTYELVSSGTTGHAESVEILFDPAKVRYEKLLDVYWHNIDPTTPDQQFPDRGHQYRTAIFYHSEAQRRAAEASKAAMEKSGRFGRPIVTEIVPATAFWSAEEYHQKYYQKCPLAYHQYHDNSGRAEFFHKIWNQ